MDPKKAITERTEAAARDLYGARPAERLRPVGYMQIETKETWKQLGRGAMSFLISHGILQGPTILTGAGFGPEASIVAVLLYLL